MATKKTTKKAPAKAGAFEIHLSPKKSSLNTTKHDWTKESNRYWESVLADGMSEEEWEFAALSIRYFKYEYPKMLWDLENRKDTYSFKEQAELATMAAMFLRMFIAAQDLSAFSASAARTKQAAAAAALRWASDPKRDAMSCVKNNWQSMRAGDLAYRSDAQFARDMMKEYGDVLSEGGIKNAITRWRKEK